MERTRFKIEYRVIGDVDCLKRILTLFKTSAKGTIDAEIKLLDDTEHTSCLSAYEYVRSGNYNGNFYPICAALLKDCYVGIHILNDDARGVDEFYDPEQKVFQKEYEQECERITFRQQRAEKFHKLIEEHPDEDIFDLADEHGYNLSEFSWTVEMPIIHESNPLIETL